MERSTLVVGTSATAEPSCAGWMPVLRRILTTLMWLLLVAYVVGLDVHGRGFEPLVDVWLGALTQVVPAAVC